mgnify:FL=1
MKKKFDKKKLHDLYMEIWNERGPICEITGRYLGKEPLTVFFDHLLEKNKYPSLIFEKKNIILCQAEVHQLKTNGFPLEKHKLLIEKAKKELLDGEQEKDS